MIYYVDSSVKRSGDGSKKNPFSKIQEAANLAVAGDKVLVSPGVYREYVNPKNKGTAENRIEYISTEPLKAIITGAEPLLIWEKVDKNIYKACVPNGIFGSYNPYTTLVSGDWFDAHFIAHTGDVYLNNKSMYEVTDIEKVKNPIRSKNSWDADFSLYTWYSCQNTDNNTTEIYANFGKLDPNKENVELSVRKNCFLPEKEGVSYITLSGFTVCKAATQWAPPTAYQDGMIGPHWSKGWIIEDCEVYESKCSGISLGKYLQPNNDNKWLKWKYKDGTQTEREVVCQASYEGWDKEHIGSHIIRRCHIHDCGQTGIVGHLGGVFSRIEDNHIHHICTKQNLSGAEIGGIKMHAAIDTIFIRNHIHHCQRGIWLDWQVQGTRVTQNLMHDNCLSFPIEVTFSKENVNEIWPIAAAVGEDIFVEVSHGPTIIDNNILLSDRSLKLSCQGVAVVHNLIHGSIAAVGRGGDNGSKNLPSPRYTPYHVPHGTQIAGFMTFLHGDARFYNNVFVAKKEIDPFEKALEANAPKAKSSFDDNNFTSGTFPYDGYPTLDEWKAQFEGYCNMGSHSEYPDRYYSELPVWFGGNYYFNGSKPADKDTGAIINTENEIRIEVVQSEDGVRIKTNLYDYLPENTTSTISTEILGMAFEPEQMFENPDGSEIIFNEDYFGEHRGVNPTAGPIEKAEDLERKLF